MDAKSKLLKCCKHCGTLPAVAKGYNLFGAPGDVTIIVKCPKCGFTIEVDSEEEAVRKWNEREV